MGKVHCIRIVGLDLWFYSFDHEPPHFHVKKTGEWEYKVFFLCGTSGMFEERWAKKDMSTSVRKEICRLVEENKQTLFEEWEKKVRG